MKELKDLSNDELCERVPVVLDQIKRSPRHTMPELMMVELAKRLRESERDRLALLHAAILARKEKK